MEVVSKFSDIPNARFQTGVRDPYRRDGPTANIWERGSNPSPRQRTPGIRDFRKSSLPIGIEYKKQQRKPRQDPHSWFHFADSSHSQLAQRIQHEARGNPHSDIEGEAH